MDKTIIEKNNSGKTRNGEIDLLRFLFAITILLFHFGKLLPKNCVPNGHISVGFFFVVSGVFMAKHAKKIIAGGKPVSIGNTTWKYIIYRTKSFYAYYFVSVILSAIFYRMLSNGMNFIDLMKSLTKTIPTFSLTFLGLNTNMRSLYVPNTWYLSALLITSFILFPILIYKFDSSTKIIFPIISMFTLGYIYANNKHILLAWENWLGLLYSGMLLAISEITLGISLFPLIEWIREKGSRGSKKLKLLFTVLKWGSFLIVFVFAFSPINKDFSIHALLYCCIGIVLSLSNLSYNIPAMKLTNYLGKCSLPIYMYHGFIKYILDNKIASGQLVMTRTFYILSATATIIGSVILMHGTDFVVGLIRSRKRKIAAADNGAGKE